MADNKFEIDINTEFPEDFSETLYRDIGKNVARVRKSKKVSQLQLSQALGMKSQSMVAQCETYYNKNHFNLEHLAKIALVLDVNISEFFN
jgi:transcriptional regulator with XRE-family HTH domain